MTPPQHTAPASRSEAVPPTPLAAPPHRIREVDALRGFALLGILLVNVQMMAGLYAGLAGVDPSATGADQAVAWIVTALVAMKFYLLFSFLFGYSFTLQVRAAQRDGAAFAPRHLRRVLGLSLLGLTHAVLLFVGDILMTYAVLGLLLYAFRNAAPRRALIAAIWLTGVLGAVLLGAGLLTAAGGPGTAGDGSTSDVTAQLSGLVTSYRGGPGAVVQANLRRLPDALSSDLVFAAALFAAFLAGLAAGRRDVLARAAAHRPLLIRILRHGLVIGLPGGVVMAVCRNGPLDSGRWSLIGTAVGVLTSPALTAAYACGLLLLLRTPPGARLAAALAPAGRLALTNYLTQSLVMALVFTGYGLGLYGRAGTATAVAGCLALYATQLALSAWLVRSTRYGPAEWLLRTATLGRRPSRAPRGADTTPAP
ncbi:DUF418 domain-containing protein [Streptomyces sp. NPDC051776]|uniref:DUF418 domain-containing protein n=1 Tax=Streptomyces sp. NPDC051776 TaxID=3155414 RepID=UPI0034267F6F